MEPDAFLNVLLSTPAPVLPDPTVMRLALQGAWAIVLGSGVLWLTGKLAPRYRWGLSLTVLLWTLLPGALSPAYWLGLAFQAPSWTSVLVCLAWCVGLERSAGQTTGHEGDAGCETNAGVVTLILLGWILLLDTLAWLPISLYAWGFSSLAVAGVALCSALAWAVLGRVKGDGRPRAPAARSAWWWPGLPLLVVALFVLTRLPTGNLWDALIDPWLWLALQFGWLVSVLRPFWVARRSPPATRA